MVSTAVLLCVLHQPWCIASQPLLHHLLMVVLTLLHFAKLSCQLCDILGCRGRVGGDPAAAPAREAGLAHWHRQAVLWLLQRRVGRVLRGLKWRVDTAVGGAVRGQWPSCLRK